MVAFFRYYLLIMALPISFLGATFTSSSGTQKTDLLSSGQIPISVFLFVIACLGFFMMCYLTGLRLEALLYARTVNGVRAYFHEMAKKDVIRVLPINPKEPKFTKFGDHGFIVLSFALFNTLYALAAYVVFFVQVIEESSGSKMQFPENYKFCLLMIFLTSFLIHILTHMHLCKKQEEIWTQ